MILLPVAGQGDTGGPRGTGTALTTALPPTGVRGSPDSAVGSGIGILGGIPGGRRTGSTLATFVGGCSTSVLPIPILRGSSIPALTVNYFKVVATTETNT